MPLAVLENLSMPSSKQSGRLSKGAIGFVSCADSCFSKSFWAGKIQFVKVVVMYMKAI